MQNDKEGFAYPAIDGSLCVDCGLCRKTCPSLHDTPRSEATFYYGWNLDDDVVRTSSSGGVFQALAQYIFGSGGSVAGAVLDVQTGEVRHMFANNPEELENLKRSKYQQSAIGDAYAETKRRLATGSPVLFSGTACQIAGLLSHLEGADRSRLLTVDVLCHGVPSKTVLDAFRASKEAQFKKRVVSFLFRIKEGEKGWQNGNGTRVKLFFADGTSFAAPNGYDTFFLGFNNNYFLRESCYRCRYCGTERISDFTLADYWSCNEPGIAPERLWLGVSAILANTDKARNILRELNQAIWFRKANSDEIVAHNLALRTPQPRPDLRDTFFDEMARNGYDRTIKRRFRKRFTRYRIKTLLERIVPLGLLSSLCRNRELDT